MYTQNFASNYNSPQEINRRKANRIKLGVGLAGGFILLTMLLAGIGVIVGLNVIKDKGPVPVKYYQALFDKNYTLAYAYMDETAVVNGQPVDQIGFTKLAAAQDAKNGSVQGYSIDGPVDQGPAVTVHVNRGGKKYDVHLQLKQINSDWKIIAADGI
jgi:hypothetical protein